MQDLLGSTENVHMGHTHTHKKHLCFQSNSPFISKKSTTERGFWGTHIHVHCKKDVTVWIQADKGLHKIMEVANCLAPLSCNLILRDMKTFKCADCFTSLRSLCLFLICIFFSFLKLSVSLSSKRFLSHH